MLFNYKIWTNNGLIEEKDAKEMRHVDSQAAVEEFVETYDKNNFMYFANYYSVTRPKPLIIFVRNERGYVVKFSLTVETVPRYYAKVIGR